jgi:hypothetical protein
MGLMGLLAGIDWLVIAVYFIAVFGLAWIPMMKLISGQLYQYLQSVQAYISPPIAHRRP